MKLKKFLKVVADNQRIEILSRDNVLSKDVEGEYMGTYERFKEIFKKDLKHILKFPVMKVSAYINWEEDHILCIEILRCKK
jgi:hypothetical protein